MALKKSDIVERLQAGLGFPKNDSNEITETLLEIIKSTLESGDASWFPGSASFASRKKRNERAGIRPPVQMPFCQRDGW